MPSSTSRLLLLVAAPAVLVLLALLAPSAPAASIPAEVFPCLETGEILLSDLDRFRDGRACNEIPNGGTFQFTNLEDRRYYVLSEPDGGRCFMTWSGGDASLSFLGNTTIELTYDPAIDRLRGRGWDDDGRALTRYNETSGNWEAEWVCPAYTHRFSPDGSVEARWRSLNQPGAEGVVRLRLG